MIDFERYLDELLFSEVSSETKVLYQKSDAEKHHTVTEYQSKLDIGVVKVSYCTTYIKLEKHIDINCIEFETKYEHATLPSFNSFKNRIESIYNIEKMINIFKEKQNIGFAKDTIKFALKEIRGSIGDYLIAKFKIIKLRLGGKVNGKNE